MGKISKLVGVLFLLVFFCLIFTSTTSAQVVINEFSSVSSDDWVEIYSPSDIDISGWVLRDDTSIIRTLPVSTFIGPSTNLFYIIDASNRLNVDTDYIKLLQSGDVILVDSVEYGGGSDLCVPTGSETIGRLPDNTGNFTRFFSATKGSSNISSENACPVPTSTSTPTPDPTDDPTPTLTPTLSLSPTPTIKPTATLTLTPKNSSTITPSVLGEENIDETSNETPLTFSETFGNSTDENSESKKDESLKKKFPWIAAIFVVVGGSLIGYALIPFFRKSKNEYNQSLEDKENEDIN